MAHAEGQQHPIGVYLQIWGLLFVLSAASYLVDYFHVQGYLRWSLILVFMALKAGVIVAVFMHMLWERLALGPGSRVLDVPCGNGRHALELASRGAVLSGIDISPEFVEEAQAQARRDGLPATFQRGDMRDLDADAAFREAVVRKFIDSAVRAIVTAHGM